MRKKGVEEEDANFNYQVNVFVLFRFLNYDFV